MANAMLDARPMWVSGWVLDALRENFERTLTVVREENATLRKLLETAHARVDALSLEVTKALVVQPTPRPSPALVPPRRTSRAPVPGVGNLLDTVPFGDAAGLFDSEAAASLMAAEDDGVPSAA